jgi:hypothetical protein
MTLIQKTSFYLVGNQVMKKLWKWKVTMQKCLQIINCLASIICLGVDPVNQGPPVHVVK